MKTFMTVMFVLALALALPGRSEAQVRVQVNLGIGHPYRYGHGYWRYNAFSGRYVWYPERVVIVRPYYRPGPVVVVRDHHHRAYRRW